MGHWQDRIVFIRDFAYPRRRRSRMANGNVGDAPAPSFAEYVVEPRLQSSSSEPSHTSAASSTDEVIEQRENEEEEEMELIGESDEKPSVSTWHEAGSSRRHSHGRPTLAHRIHTQNLRVQANAKSLRARLLSGPLVEIHVGKDKKQWSLHRNLLCHHSELLSSELLPSESNQNPELRIDLPSNDPAGFELLVKWLYQGKLDDVSDIVDPVEKYGYAVNCYGLWLICDRFDMPQLMNHAIDQYRKGLHEAELVPDADEINEIYRATAEGSPFRRLMVKIAARQIMDPHTERDANTYKACLQDNADFAVELVNAIKNDSGGMLFADPTLEGDRCMYHDHEEEPRCHLKTKRSTQSKAMRETIPAKRPLKATSTNRQRLPSHPSTLDPLLETNPSPPTGNLTPPLTPPLRHRRHASEILHRRISGTSATSLASSLISPLNVIAQRRPSRDSSTVTVTESENNLRPDRYRARQDAILRRRSSDAKAMMARDGMAAGQSWWGIKWQWGRTKSTPEVMSV